MSSEVANQDDRIPSSEPDGDAGPDPAWHAHEADAVVALLSSDAARGLDGTDAARRLERDGPNQLHQDAATPWWQLLLRQFTSPLIGILLVALVITIAIDELVDAAVIAAVLVLNAVIGFTQERKADRSVHALMELAAPKATVVRDGRERDVPATELVRGDVVALSSGVRVPADLKLLRATTLEVDESLLTGESLAARKDPTPDAETALPADRRSMCFLGTSVSSGRARGIVVATGTDTQLGRIAEEIRGQQRPDTPLQQRMHRFANLIALVVLASSALAFVLGIAMGGEVSEMFLTAVALAVAVVPEGLPVAFTVAMALGVHRMARRGAIIRSLPAVETLGSTDAIGSDKTGTLTANQMTVRRLWTAAGPAHVTRASDPPGDIDEAAARLTAGEDQLAETLRTGVLSNEAALVFDDGEVVDHRGDPTESALLEVAHHLGVEVTTVRDEAVVLADVPFESDLGFAAIVVDEDGPVQRVKGAPERIVERCTHVGTADGPVAIDPDEILTAAASMARDGLRVLAMAQRRLPADVGVDPNDPPAVEGLTCTGLIGMQDPPRAGVRDAIARVQEAGIRVLMITGDHAETARAIADDLGIGVGRPRALTGQDLQIMDDAALRAAIHEVDVFARVTPEHKLRVVHALQAHDQVVAVTGDGVNDGPALKAADIGVAMGRSGTDVAREASDMVLTDDAFVSIVSAVEEGRVVFDNVRKVTFFLLSTGVASIVAILAAMVAGLPLPYVPAALLWLNVVTNGLQDVALAFEPGEPDVLDHPPRARSEGIVSRQLWERTVLTGLTMAAGSMWLFTWAIGTGLDADQQRGAALTTLVVAMAAHVYNARSERRSILATGIAGNRFLLAATCTALVIHLAASAWGPTRFVLQIAPVTPAGWWRISLVALAVVGVSEAHKAWGG
ncbi:MAG: HAD-IC family P-type ATPase, partial [Nitriliruptoraceae bacterium]|nr:HAD-IC family P-type ATPase [Nitriliruptoraceae bacterium]